MFYSEYVKQRIVSFHNHGLKAPSIVRALGRDRVGVHKILVKYIPGNGGSSMARWLWETPESYRNHQNDSVNHETGKLKNERGCTPTSFAIPFRFLVSVLSCNFRFGFVPYRVSVQAFIFHFTSVSLLHRLRATETEC